MKIQKMNKEKFKNWTIFLFFLVGSVLNSCSNFLSFDENRTDENKTSAQDDKCIITVSSDFYSNDGSRAAFPDFLLSPDTLYFAEISYTSGSSKKWLGEDSVSETAVVLKNNYSDVIRFVFCAPQETSSYTLALYACPKQTGSQVSAVKKSAFAQGDAAFELSAGQKVLSSTLNIKLRLQESSGKGKVNLPVSFDSALGIVAAKVNVTKDGEPDSSGNNYGFKMEVSGSGARLSAENVPAGTYLAIMKFYNSTTDFSSSTEVAVNSAVQHISVYSEMTTNLWFIGGKKHGTTAADGTFKPSALELTKYDFTELYVCGKDGGAESDGKRSFYVSSNFAVPDASDTDGDGSMAKPFETVQKAVDTIAASGDTSKKYTIYVDGTVEAPYDDFTNGTFISIGTTASNLDLTIKGLSADARAVLNARQKSSYKGCVLTSENTSLTLENLKITGGKENNSGGIYIKSGNLTLKNCVVTKNESSNGGGGIQFDGEKLIVEDSEISGNNGDPGGIWVKEDWAQTKIKNSNIKDNVASSGGGGLKLAGESTIEGCNITGNKAESSTGGVGGGLILSIDNKSCKIKKSVISNNTAGESGGGIYMIDGELRLGSGAVIGEKLDPDVAENDISKVATDKKYGNRSTKKLTSDTGTDFDVGAGIFVAGGKVLMYEDSYICRNYTECSGGGVFIKEGAEFFMYGGVVGWNRSNFGGGILCEGRLGLSYSSRICYNKVSTQLVQGFCGRGAGIAVNGENDNVWAAISDRTKIFGNSALRGANSSTNTDALGAGIYSSGRLTINGEIQIYDNYTDSDGAAIGIEGGTATLSGCKIYSNRAGRNGGAIFISSVDQNKDAETPETLAIKKDVSIYSNSTAGGGGAIYATTNPSSAAGKCSYVTIGEDKNTEGIVIKDNNAKRGGAFYGANNARFVMNAGKVSENYSTGNTPEHGGGAMFIWGGDSNYSTFTMNGGEIIGNMAKDGGAGGAVHIDHGSGGMASFIMTGGLLSGNKAADKNGTGSKLGGAIYVKNGGQIKLGGSAVIAVSEESDNCNDIYLGINEKTSVQQKITITGILTPGNNVKYTARITPQTYTVGKELFQSDTYTITSDDYGKFCVTGNAESDEWFITSAGYLSKPAAISGFSDVPDFNKYPRLTVSTGDEMKTLADWVNAGNNMKGVTFTLLSDVTIDSMIGGLDKNFYGTFDGNGKTITSNGSLMTIFYSVNGGGVIKNLTSAGKFSCSGIVNNLYQSTVENCINNAEITNDMNNRCAGIVGVITGGNIKNCINNGNISNTCSEANVGGICGKAVMGGLILNCTNKGAVSNITDSEDINSGGICGYSVSDTNKILNCINLGEIKKTTNNTNYYIGGISGKNFGSVNNCVNIGTIEGNNAKEGAIAGYNGSNAVIENSYFLTTSAYHSVGAKYGQINIWTFDSSFKTENDLTVEGTTSSNLIDLLNAWVDVKNSSGTEQYLSWGSGVDGKLSLVY